MPTESSPLSQFAATPAWPWILAALLGVGLAASSGLRAFLPLLILAAAAKWNLFGVQLGSSFAWLASDTALAALAIAAFVETAGDKIPAVDHMLDVLGTVVRPAAGALVSAAALSGGQAVQDPMMAGILGLVVGAPVALGLHSAKAGTRGVSSASTMGVGNPVLSVVEDVTALFMGLLSLLLPLLVPLFVGLGLLLIWKVFKVARRYSTRRATA